MNKKQRKLIFKTLKDQFIRGEDLKKQGLLNEFKISATIQNLSLNEKGKLQYDVVMNVYVMPKTTPKFIDLNFTVLPTGCKFD